MPQNVISKWVNGQVDQASPDNLKKIAPTLGMTYEALLRAMGEIPSPHERTEHDLVEQAIRQSTAEMQEVVRDIPREFWPTIIRKTLRRAVDTARDMAELIAAEDTAGNAPPNEAPSEPGITEPRRPQRPIKPREPAFA